MRALLACCNPLRGTLTVRPALASRFVPLPRLDLVLEPGPAQLSYATQPSKHTQPSKSSLGHEVPVDRPALQLYKAERYPLPLTASQPSRSNTFFHIVTAFAVVNSAFWSMFYDLSSQVLTSWMLTALPYFTVVLVVLPWLARWAFGRNYILSLRLNEGWRELEATSMGMVGPVPVKIDLYSIAKGKMLRNEEQFLFKAQGSPLLFIVDHKRGIIPHEPLLLDILNGKPPLPPPAPDAPPLPTARPQGGAPLRIKDGTYEQGKVKDGVWISKSKI